MDGSVRALVSFVRTAVLVVKRVVKIWLLRVGTELVSGDGAYPLAEVKGMLMTRE